MDSITTGALINGVKMPTFSFPQSRRPRPSPKRLAFPILATSDSVTPPRLSSSSTSTATIVPELKRAAGAVIFAAALLVARFPARATTTQPPLPSPPQETTTETSESSALLSNFLELSPEAISSLRSLLYQKLETGEDDAEALQLLNRLVAAQPSELEWKFLSARLLNEMGRLSESRAVYDDILSTNPLCFEALFENSVLMDRMGEGKEAVDRLERAVETAKEGKKEKEARDVRLVVAQLKYLQKKTDESLKIYEELAKEDEKDFRPWFCRGVIYSLMDRNEEARAMFRKYRELSPKNPDVEGFLQTPLSRVKLF